MLRSNNLNNNNNNRTRHNTSMDKRNTTRRRRRRKYICSVLLLGTLVCLYKFPAIFIRNDTTRKDVTSFLGFRSANSPRGLIQLNPKYHLNRYPFTNFLDVSKTFSYSSFTSLNTTFTAKDKDKDDSSEDKKEDTKDKKEDKENIFNKTETSNNKIVGYYWQVPRCGGTTMKHIMSTCLRRIQADRTSRDYCDMDTMEIQTCKTKVGTFVNADPSDHNGIQRCLKMDLVQSGIPDVITSSRMLHAATLFSEDNAGRMFTILRHPIERAVSTFYYLQNAYWERNYRPDLKEMTLLDYAALPETASNWMTRWLTGKNADPNLSQEDLEFAKALLERKFLIMLTDKMATSMERLIYYMDWEESATDSDHYEETRNCMITNTKEDTTHWNKNQHLMPDIGTVEYDALYAINALDMQLYEHAKIIFNQQTAMFHKRRKQRVVDLFLGEVTISNKTKHDNSIVEATKRSDYEASQAAAALLERPPEDTRSIEATNSLVATALMLHTPSDGDSTFSLLRQGKNETIASKLARQQNGMNKWGSSSKSLNKIAEGGTNTTTVDDVDATNKEEEEEEHDIEYDLANNVLTDADADLESLRMLRLKAVLP